MSLNEGNGRGRRGGGTSDAQGRLALAQSAPAPAPAALKREVVSVTPEQAKAWLETYNTANRPVRWADVRELARRMDVGEWHLNGDALRFDEHGNLYEGQHRLQAVVLHGRPVLFEVLRNMPYSDRFEDGGRPRSMADYLVIAGLARTTQGIKTAALVEVVGSLIDGNPRGFNGRNSAHKREAIALCREHYDSIQWAFSTFPNKAITPVVGAMVFGHHRRQAVVEKFVAYWLGGERTARSPATALDALVTEVITSGRKGVPAYRLEIAQRTLTAIHAFEKNKPLTVVRRSQAVVDWFLGAR